MAILVCGLMRVSSNLQHTCPAAVAGLVFDEECVMSAVVDVGGLL